MASLWRPLRLLAPLQSTLSQPLGLRACKPLQSRLLHSSPILHARKPSKAVVKPLDASAPTRKKQHKDALRKQHYADRKHELEQPHAPALATPTSPTISTTTTTYQPSTPPPTIHQPIALASTKQHPVAKQPVDAISTSLSTSPRKPTFEYVPGGRSGIQQSLRELASAESPTLIYEATKARQYIAWCLFASLLLGCVAAMQIGFFTTDPSKGDLRIASVFLLTALMWAILASWAAFGANDVIKKIWAIPSSTGRPLLRLEPVKIAFGKRPLPFDVPLGRVFSDKSFEQTIAHFNATRDVRRKPGVLDALFGPVGTIMSANMKMIQRKSSFAQLRVADSGVWKVDLRDCKVPDGGKTLDLLILPSERKRGWFASLFIQDV
ncbi:hypothetical protein E4T50_08643 [Aureobasidium sp. EXF-12298]|nr:hypothetical protein E4T50_08643 [Aureobasidium sp. EXF-12298]KAI4763937.1 hypothetical protein E4T51_03055 [Aureobasidium sp. EXF-12344]KAI4780033.1 hypothetical protein E4T52_05071 [Aureobasidium sp. EXF-3400]